MRTNRPNKQILEEAAQWFVDFRAGDIDAQSRQAFNAWLRTSPEHIQAYLDVSAFWEDAPRLAARDDVDVQALVASARDDGNIVTLAPETGRTTPESVRSPFRRYALAACAALLVIAGATTAALYFPDRDPVYSTAIGEQKSIALDDGSTVELNSRSRIRVRFTDEARDIELLAGQALFRVARDPHRPFIVRSDDIRVRAVGTQFDVHRKSTGTIITVIEGRVAIEDMQVQLTAGEQVTLTPDSLAPEPQPANLSVATAWTQRRIIFQSASLQEVAEEFNRYNRRQLIVHGPGLDDFHLSGVFSSTDPTSLVRFLRERFDVRIEESDREIHIHPPLHN